MSNGPEFSLSLIIGLIINKTRGSSLHMRDTFCREQRIPLLLIYFLLSYYAYYTYAYDVLWILLYFNRLTIKKPMNFPRVNLLASRALKMIPNLFII